MQNYIKCFENIILFNNELYHDNSEKIYLNNRFNITYTIKNINLLPSNSLDNIEVYDNTILYIEGFHGNMGHLLWDYMYPSWYGLFFNNETLWNNNFQWVTNFDLYQKWSKGPTAFGGGKGNNRGWHLDLLEKFSGFPVTTFNDLSNKYQKPIKIKKLICGIKNIGIACVNKDITISKSFRLHSLDPVETFVNRMFHRFQIKRNYYINDNDNIINIIYIQNKRSYRGINELFQILNSKYKNKYNFKIINLKNYTFEEQLNIFNTTRIIICGVGTARTNTPFIPNGSIEIQTNNHSNIPPNYISFFDTHIGTFSNYVKVINIDKYLEHESKNQLVSKDLEFIIENTLTILPYNLKINILENIPKYVRENIDKITNEQYLCWRNSGSNSIEDLLN